MMPIHHITEQNQAQFYCRNCEEPLNGDAESVLADGIDYKVQKCGCGQESWQRENIHTMSYADGDVFLSLDLILS